MWHRFFILIYSLLSVGVIAFVPIYFAIDSNNRSNYGVNYKPKCIENGEYVVYLGGRADDHLTVTKASLDAPIYGDRKEINFYCEYYSVLQPYILGYHLPTNTYEKNMEYFNFKKEKLAYTSSYPELFVLEKQYDKDYWGYTLIYPLIDSLTFGVLLFLALQILKIFYTFIKFGEFSFNPFRARK